MGVPRIGRPHEDGAQPDWQRLKYPTEAEFDRVARDHAEIAYSEEANDFKSYFALPPWVRLGWPSQELWGKCKNIPAIAKARYEDLKAMYPDRPGVKAEDQDFYRLMRYWPDCYGRPFVEVVVPLTKDVIQINKLTYSRGTHRVPAPVAADLARISQLSMHERLKAMMPSEHAEQTIAELRNTGAVVGAIL